MAIAELDMWNAALARTGAREVNDIDEVGDNATICRRFFNGCRDESLILFPWSCTLHRQTLVQDTVAPDFEFDYKYSLPNDPWCLRPLECYQISTSWVIEGRCLLTNAEDIYLKYIKRQEEVAQFEPLLSQIIEVRLASKIAYRRTETRSLVETLLGEYRMLLEEAMEIEAFSQDGPFEPNEEWVQAGR